MGAPIDDKKAPATRCHQRGHGVPSTSWLNQLVDTDDAEEAKDNDEE